MPRPSARWLLAACALLPLTYWSCQQIDPGQVATESSVTVPVESLVNFESPHVHPLDQTPDGTLLLAVNTAAARLEIFNTTGALTQVASIPVGLDPVTVRARSNNEAWVVNHISDSISVIDLSTLSLIRTFTTADEPTDVVFAGSPSRAYVSCSAANLVQVYDPDAPGNPIGAPQREVPIGGEDPRQLAVSADGQTVYAAIFESGNATTILGGGTGLGWPPDALEHPAGPYGGLSNPPPNNGVMFEPEIRSSLPAPPEVGLIVRRDGSNRWMDDNNGDWTDLVSGANASASGRPVGWDIADRDVAIISTDAAIPVRYAGGMMTTAMALSVHPLDGQVMLVGTEATNEIRYEPNLRGTFIRVRLGAFSDTSTSVTVATDLNPHLTYTSTQVTTADDLLRARSIGDPRAIAWRDSADRGYVAGMGSNNVIIIDQSGARLNPISAPTAETIEVSEGPTGLVVNENAQRLYVLNRFTGSISEIDLSTESVIDEVPYYDPTPAVIRAGRRHLYSTHDNSALGQIACASCHQDARMDRLAWDLGDPSGEMETIETLAAGGDYNLRFETEPSAIDFHPMKWPMVTQTLQGIIGNEPLHWRGDQPRFHDFSAAFDVLQGTTEPSQSDMQEFADFLATIHFPPNPFRNPDNSLPTDVPLLGYVATGRHAPAGTPLPNGNAQRGLTIYRETASVPGGVQESCNSCHSLPTGSSADLTIDTTGAIPVFEVIPPGPLGERHLWVSGQGSMPDDQTLKVPQLRNLAERISLDYNTTLNLGGFGLVHDGTMGSLPQLLTVNIIDLDLLGPAFPDPLQNMADVIALLLSMTGPGLPEGSFDASLRQPPGAITFDVHAGVGRQVTVDAAGALDPAVLASVTAMIPTSTASEVELIVRGGDRGALYDPATGLFNTDLSAETVDFPALLTIVNGGTPLTFTLVASGTGGRLALDRDADGCLDRDEALGGTDPADPGDCTPAP